MELLSKVVFSVVTGAVIGVLDRGIGSYPPPLPRSRDPRMEIREVLLLWLVAVAVPILRLYAITPWLERALGQGRAVVWGGILFGLTHVAFDISRLMASEGGLAVCLAVLLQTMAGWFFGIIYVKTRSLWPGIACHYSVNWLSAILAGLLR
jgi:membrane protease YdiL (CAAX protease family)